MADGRDREHLSAAQRAKIRRLSEPRELAPDEEGGELNIVPFLDIIMNVLMFVLATITVTFTALIDITPPRATGSRSANPTKPTLSLSVVVVRDGFAVSAFGRSIQTGCVWGTGIAVPSKEEGGKRVYDYKTLAQCATKVKGIDPEFAAEKDVTISANADVPYQVIVSTMDALRVDDKGKDLFPNVYFSAVQGVQ